LSPSGISRRRPIGCGANPETNFPRWIEGARAWGLRMHNDAIAYDMEILNEYERTLATGAQMLPSLINRSANVDEH
jgi:hypothetical protein